MLLVLGSVVLIGRLGVVLDLFSLVVLGRVLVTLGVFGVVGIGHNSTEGHRQLFGMTQEPPLRQSVPTQDDGMKSLFLPRGQ